MDIARRTTSRRGLLRSGLLLGSAAVGGLAGTAAVARAASTGASSVPRSAAGYPQVHWSPASTKNYTAANRPNTYPVQLVVIHVTQETYADTITLFQNPSHAASAHYVVRSSDGFVGQCVDESDVAWHAGNWDYNTRSIGVEHEGWVDRPEYFTQAMYKASASLTSAICDRYGIPKDRDHIIGHSEVPGATHTDPGPLWDWSLYLRLVNGT